MKYIAKYLRLGIFPLVLSLNVAVWVPASWDYSFREWPMLFLPPCFVPFSGFVAMEGGMGEKRLKSLGSSLGKNEMRLKLIDWYLFRCFLNDFYGNSNWLFCIVTGDSCQASVATLVYREVGTTSDLSLGMEPGGPVGSRCWQSKERE